MFVFLAASFGVGFIAFGVGSNVQGGLDQLFSGRAANNLPDVEEARKAARANPRNPQAQLALSEALQQAGKGDQAIAPLERYAKLKRTDEDALEQLAGLYLSRAQRLQTEAAIAQQEAADLDPGRDFMPTAQSPLGQALAAQSSFQPAQDANDRFNQAYTQLQDTYGDAVRTYQRLARLSPTDATIQIQLAQAAQNTGDAEVTLRAYKRFLKLAPDDPSAADVRAQVKAIEQASRSSGPGG